jgi:hypothetical protein
MGQSKKINERLDELLALQRKHAASARECADCGNLPLSTRDPLSAVMLADPATGEICAGCQQILDSVDAFYVVAIPPRGIVDADAAD